MPQNTRFSLPVGPADILLPTPGMDLTAWATVACDQFTSEPEYWREAEALAQGKPSTLRFILPECHLPEADARIPAINAAMTRAAQDGTLQTAVTGGMVLCARRLRQGAVRLGLVLSVDLECYDYAADSTSPIRATEGTIAARIPPRLRVRENAPLELPHILLLADDPDMSVIEPLYAARGTLRPLYDMPLMMDGGHAQGWAVEGDVLQSVQNALNALCAKHEGGIQFAVGDGNHSLATARAHWLRVRKELPPDQRSAHPARYALCELENIHDPALHFEPIHRVVTGADADDLLRALHPQYDAVKANSQRVTVITPKNEWNIALGEPCHPLTVGTLQKALDEYIEKHPRVQIDYIHGLDNLRAVVRRGGGVGFALPAMDKSELFPAVERGGPLPRKTFSMGEARDKRYYIEARRIIE